VAEAIITLPCRHVGQDGPCAIVAIDTIDGTEEIVIGAAATSVAVKVVERDGSRLLVELPAESTRGNWRIWVRSPVALVPA
jgi:hypothetical protein